MVNYKNGKIYKLISDQTDKIYIGSTCSELHKRLYQHKKIYTYWKHSFGKGYISSIELIKEGEVEIVLIENYSCNDKNELHAREKYWIDQNKDKIVNKNIPARTQKEYAKLEELCECGMNYYKCKKYEHLGSDKHKNALNNMEKKPIDQKAKVLCECGLTYTHSRRASHMNTDKHINAMKSIDTKL